MWLWIVFTCSHFSAEKNHLTNSILSLASNRFMSFAWSFNNGNNNNISGDKEGRKTSSLSANMKESVLGLACMCLCMYPHYRIFHYSFPLGFPSDLLTRALREERDSALERTMLFRWASERDDSTTTAFNALNNSKAERSRNTLERKEQASWYTSSLNRLPFSLWQPWQNENTSMLNRFSANVKWMKGENRWSNFCEISLFICEPETINQWIYKHEKNQLIAKHEKQWTDDVTLSMYFTFH